MKLLLLNTCGAEASFALADTSRSEPVQVGTMPGRSASEMLVGLLRGAMAEAGWKMTEIGAVGVVTGPGSFTGVRVGLSAAKGLSEALGAPLIAASRLELLASRVSRHQGRAVCALLDAGRGEFYCGRYRGDEALGESLLSLEEAIVVGAEADEVVLCEDAADRTLLGRLAVTRVPDPTAGDAVSIVLRRFEQGEVSDAATLDANYLRRTDVEIFVSSPKRAG